MYIKEKQTLYFKGSIILQLDVPIDKTQKTPPVRPLTSERFTNETKLYGFHTKLLQKPIVRCAKQELFEIWLKIAEYKFGKVKGVIALT